MLQSMQAAAGVVPDGANSAIHHVGGGHHICSSSGLGHSLAAQELHGLIIQNHASITGYPVVTVR